MNYNQTLDYLFSSLPMFQRVGAAAYKADLKNTIAICKELGNPQNKLQCIHVAGTNGKGSTCLLYTSSASSELAKLEKNLSILNVTGRIAPMFGFIGTIFGVIKIFYDIALAKTVEIEVISTGLYQKMITSAGGLVVGVLAFVAFQWLNARIDKIANRMEETQIHFLDMLNEPGK